MPKKLDGLVKIRGLLRTVTSQTIQYKPFGYELDFANEPGTPVVVEMEIPAIDVLEVTQDALVVDLDGFKAILKLMANTLDEVDAEYKQKYQGGGR